MDTRGTNELVMLWYIILLQLVSALYVSLVRVKSNLECIQDCLPPTTLVSIVLKQVK